MIQTALRFATPTAEWIDIGEFMVASGKLIVSDPCYSRGMWCAGVIENARNSTWRVTLETTGRGHRTLTASCASPLGEMRKAPFRGAVDSGQVGIFCDSLFPTPWNPSPGFHQSCEAAGLGELQTGIVLGGGVVASLLETGYRAFVGRDRDRQAVAVQITLDD
jgi:hypothetical protein